MSLRCFFEFYVRLLVLEGFCFVSISTVVGSLGR